MIYKNYLKLLNFSFYRYIFIIFSILILSLNLYGKNKIIIASTTSTYDTGLLNLLNDKFLDAQDTHEESTLGLTGGIDFLSTGFQLKTTDGGGNGNNEEYIYMAWREAS